MAGKKSRTVTVDAVRWMLNTEVATMSRVFALSVLMSVLLSGAAIGTAGDRPNHKPAKLADPDQVVRIDGKQFAISDLVPLQALPSAPPEQTNQTKIPEQRALSQLKGIPDPSIPARPASASPSSYQASQVAN